MTDQIEGGFVPAIKALLWILSKIYLLILVLRRAAYQSGLFKSFKLPKPVISVGNLTMGGVGKTPLVGFLVKALKGNGSRPAVLMRGYMEQSQEGQAPQSDEAAMLETKWNVSVLAGADRVKNAQSFLQNNTADVFLLDDGFQHWRLSRDLDIVTIDATNPWGNGHVLPRGILREPKDALARADVFVLTKVDLGKEHLEEIKAELKRFNPKALVVEAIHKPVLFSDLRSGAESDFVSIRGHKICTVCGIGSPNSFIKTLVELEADIGEHFGFMDHHVYSIEDIRNIIEVCQSKGIETVVTTEKDAVKWKTFLNVFPEMIRVLSLKIEISIVHEEAEFLDRIYHLL